MTVKALSDLHQDIEPPSNRAFGYALIAALVTEIALTTIGLFGVYAAQTGVPLYLPAVLPAIAAILCMIPFIILGVKEQSKANRDKEVFEKELKAVVEPLEGAQKTKEERISFIEQEILLKLPRYKKEYLIGRLQALLPQAQYPAINEALTDIMTGLYPKDK